MRILTKQRTSCWTWTRSSWSWASALWCAGSAAAGKTHPQAGCNTVLASLLRPTHQGTAGAHQHVTIYTNSNLRSFRTKTNPAAGAATAGCRLQLADYRRQIAHRTLPVAACWSQITERRLRIAQTADRIMHVADCWLQVEDCRLLAVGSAL